MKQIRVKLRLKGYYTTGLDTTVSAKEYRSDQKSVLKCNSVYFSPTESQFTLNVYYSSSILRTVHLSKADHRHWQISNTFFEKFLGHETIFFSNLYNAVINFDLCRKVR